MELPPNEMAGEWLQPDSVNGLHSVTRTWNWLFANPERVRSLPVIGRSCARLVRLVKGKTPIRSVRTDLKPCPALGAL